MTNPQIFNELNEYYEEVSEGTYVEPAMAIDDATNTVYPGVHISAQGMEIPMFLSVQDLRDMADEAERILIEQLEQAQGNKTKNKIKK